ncbi:MAG: DNA polymerase I [Spirochaetes bacterium]|nr:MAG: DNA polymerase I [Spirochaetota bacterium]
MNEPAYLIDAYSLIYRSYFAFFRNPLKNSKGKNVSAVFGFFRTLFQLIRIKQPKSIAVVMDSKKPTFRHKKYPLYKATREKAPEDLHAQIPLIEEILKALGIYWIRVDGYEADDIIATIAIRLKESETPCYILSGDKDILQLVGKNIKVIHPEKGVSAYKEWGEDDVLKNRGVHPYQIVDYLALAGDQADNIPGVKGIGDKTAVKLLNRYGSLDGIYKDIDTVKPQSLQDKLIKDKDNAFLSRDLAVLHREVPVPMPSDLLTVNKINIEKAIPLFAREGMKSLVEELKSMYPGYSEEAVHKDTQGELFAEYSGDSRRYELVNREADLDRWISLAEKKGTAAFDSETTGLDEMEAAPIGFSLSVEEGAACYIPVKAKNISCIPEDTLKKKLAALLENPGVKIIGQNIKYDYKILKRWGVTIKNIYFDTMLAAYLLESSSSSYGMDRLAENYLNYKTIHYSDIIDKPKEKTLAEIDIERVVEYAGEDADITFRLFNKFKPLLEEEGMHRLFYDIEMPLVQVLAEMELRGIKLEADKLKTYSGELKSRLNGIEEKIFELCGQSFNINSTKQLQQILFGLRKLKPVKRTKTGYSTDTAVLKELAEQDPIPQLVLQHRQLSKLKSTYVDALPLLINKRTGRVHTHFMQTGTATGRLSSNNPNLQNIPIREEEGRKIRDAFVAEDGSVFLSADYSQIELAILAYLSKDTKLLEVFKRRGDIHRQTAALIFGIPEEEVSSSQRRIGKTINFGVIYGMSPFRLARDLKIPRKDAELFINTYFEKYSGVSNYIKNIVEEAEEKGYVKTIMGRKRKINGISSGNKTEKMAASRIAVNTPIQGSAADIVKIAMIKIFNELKNNNLKSSVLLQVHDELILEVPEKELKTVSNLVKATMENVVEIPIPLRVNIETGRSWGDIH